MLSLVRGGCRYGDWFRGFREFSWKRLDGLFWSEGREGAGSGQGSRFEEVRNLLFVFSSEVDRAVIQVFPTFLGAGPANRLVVVSSEEMWGNVVVFEAKKTRVILFPIVRGDFVVVVVEVPGLIWLISVDWTAVPLGVIVDVCVGIRRGSVSVSEVEWE